MAARLSGKNMKKLSPENLTFASAKDSLPQAPPGKKWVPRKRWWQCGPVKWFLLIIAGIFVLNFASLKREEAALVPEGNRYDIGWGQKLFMRCTGTGAPVIVLDAPIGDTSDIWLRVEPSLAKHTKVCVYDRAGLGFSDRSYKNTSSYAQDFSQEAKKRDRLLPGTVERMVDDLHRLVHKAVGNEKIMLVSVDFSTLISRFYAQFYESEVSGVILIDPMIETLFDNNSTWSHYWYEKVLNNVNMLYLSAMFGLNRLALLTGLIKPIQDQAVMKLVNADYVNRKKYFMCNSVHLSSVMEEIYHTNTSLSQVKTVYKVKPFPEDLPVTMATYRDSKGPTHQLAKLWKEGQEELKVVHPDIKHIILPGTDYNTLLHNSQAVSSLILSKLRQIRTNK